MLGPQSTVFFVLLMAAFVALLWWMCVAKQLVFRVLAGCLAFIPAVMFGVAAVNKYYDYYPSWSSAIADLTGQNLSAPVLPYIARRPGERLGRLIGRLDGSLRLFRSNRCRISSAESAPESAVNRSRCTANCLSSGGSNCSAAASCASCANTSACAA